MELSNFANKRFAVYGLGFHGDNVKAIGKEKWNPELREHYADGNNVINGSTWGKFRVYRPFITSWFIPLVNEYGDLIFDYNVPGNNWHKRWLPDIRKLTDRNFHKVKFYDLPTNILAQIKSHYPDFVMLNIIEGTAYWWKLRIGKFWMVEVS